MKGHITAGLTVLAGVAFLEVALIPAVVIGGAAVLAPRYLPKLRRRLQPTHLTRRGAQRLAVQKRSDREAPRPTLAKLGIKQAIAKTITFRIIVTTLDFTTNYLVIGELTAAAGLSTFNLIAGPLFYLTHEAAWNYFGASEAAAVDIQPPQSLWGVKMPLPGWGPVKVSRALAKTITFRTIATVVDFTANYVVVRDVAMAAGLSAFAFVVGPFVYLGHEKVWEHYSSSRERLRPPANLLNPRCIGSTPKSIPLRRLLRSSV